jgi:hypothetical protein
MMGETIRCPQCPRWLGVQRTGYIESTRKGRSWQIVTGTVECEQCGAMLRIVAGRPSPSLFTFNGQPVTPAELKEALAESLGSGFRVAS